MLNSDDNSNLTGDLVKQKCIKLVFLILTLQNYIGCVWKTGGMPGQILQHLIASEEEPVDGLG